MEARNRTLPDWLTRVRTRQIVLPRFQRFEAWGYLQIVGLLNTVIRDLPAGAVLTLEIGNEEPFLSRPVSGAPTSGEKITEHLLDGQQRLTALWKSLNGLYEDRTYYIKCEKDEDLELPYYATSIARYAKNGSLYPLWAEKPNETWERFLIPVSLLRPDVNGENEFKKWAQLAANNDMEKLLYLIEIGGKLRNKFTQFNIPFLSLPVSTTPETALDVFIQMNTSSSPLTPFDIVVAQIEGSTGKSLHSLIEDLKSNVPNISRYYNNPEDIALAVAALLQDKLPSKGVYLSKDFSTEFENKWNSVVIGIKKAVTFLSDERLFDSRRLPTDVILYVISALWAIAPEGLDKEGEIRTIVRKYVWRSFFTDRYDQTTNHRAYSDFKELKSLIIDKNGKPEIFDDLLFPLPSVDELCAAGWPYRKDRLARAILAISLKMGGFDFADGSVASYDGIQNREYHHIFPKAWLEKKSYKEHQINTALNCALISWKTNRNISDKNPSDYVVERMKQSSLGNDEVHRRLKSHQIDIQHLEANDYENFIQARASSIRDLLVKLCDGEIVLGML